MKQNKIIAMIMMVLVLALITAIAGCTSSGTSDATGLKAGLADNKDFKIEVIGGKTSPMVITWEDLKAMNFVEKNGVTMINSVGTEKTSDFVGVPMMDIVNKAGVPDGEVSFKVVAPDGYSKVYTAEQMEKSILGLKENGTALTDNINKKSIKMVVPGEPGDMWMKQPVKIEIVQGTAVNVNSKEPIALNITGNVEKQMKMRISDLRANPSVTITTPYKDNQTLTATGVSLNKLLDEAKPKSDATQVKFTAADGYNKTIDLTDIRGSQDAIISFQDDGTLKAIIPGVSFGAWVGQLVDIEVI